MSPTPLNANPASNDDTTLKFKEIIRSNGILDKVSEVIIKDAGLQGEGFASVTQCVTVKFENPKLKPLNLFVKGHSSSESHSQMLDEMHAFEKEAKFLTDYVSAAEKLCKSKGVPGASELYPKCYYGDGKIIVLENLVLDKGYCLLDKGERQDLEAAKFAVETLAKHHAIAHAMIEENQGADKFFKRFPNLDFEAFDKPIFMDMMGPSLTNALKSNIGLLEKNVVGGKDEALSFFNGFKDVPLIDLIVNALKCDENEFSVLNHGDYWNNNMMFLKDKETDKLIGHKAIDLQITRYNSPALDLGYYMFTSVKTQVRLAHQKEIFELYLDVLNQLSSDLGHPINLSYEELFLSYRKKFDYGYWFSMCMVIGPGMEIMKDFDISTLDVKDWPVVFDQLFTKWLNANPEYGKVIAEELVLLAREYKKLSLK